MVSNMCREIDDIMVFVSKNFCRYSSYLYIQYTYFVYVHYCIVIVFRVDTLVGINRCLGLHVVYQKPKLNERTIDRRYQCISKYALWLVGIGIGKVYVYQFKANVHKHTYALLIILFNSCLQWLYTNVII